MPTHPGGPKIFELSFTPVAQYRPFAIVAPGFVADEEPGGQPPHVLVRSAHCPAAPYAAVEVAVTGTSGTTDRILAGLATADGEHVLAIYDCASGRVGIEVHRAGRTRLVRRKKVRLPDEFRMAFVLCENQVTVLVDTSDGWRPVLTERNRVAALFDLRRPETLSEFRYAWGSRPSRSARQTSRPAEVGAVRSGLFGMTGIRDQHLVQHSDGRPYMRDGKVYLTATCAGMGFFRQAHWGVFTLDLADPTQLTQVGQLFSMRDGLLLGDHAGQVVRDDDNDRWIIANSSWGDFDLDGVHVRHTTSTEDVLHGVHVLQTEATLLPTNVSSWDPGLTKIDDSWHVSFVESPSQKPFDFHPALASGGAHWPGDLRLVGAATDLHQCEGPILTRLDDAWWLLASDGDAREYPVFTLGMSRGGRLDAPYPSNIPHPQLVPLEDGGYLLVTFEGTQFAERVLGYGGHGDVVVMRGDPA